MEFYFEKSLQKIKELSKVPSEKEWNVIAKLENYLTSESLKYITGKEFKILCQEIRAN